MSYTASTGKLWCVQISQQSVARLRFRPHVSRSSFWVDGMHFFTPLVLNQPGSVTGDTSDDMPSLLACFCDACWSVRQAFSMLVYDLENMDEEQRCSMIATERCIQTQSHFLVSAGFSHIYFGDNFYLPDLTPVFQMGRRDPCPPGGLARKRSSLGQCSIIFQWQTFQIPLERANITTTCDTNLESRCETYGYNTSFDGQAAPLPCDEKIVDSQGVGLHVSFYSLLLMQIFK